MTTTEDTTLAEDRPEIDFAELDDQHFKTYMSKSLKSAIRRFARREGMTDSEAGRALFMLALEQPSVFGGYKAKNGARTP